MAFHNERQGFRMQKIFIKYTVVIMTSASFLILFINVLFSSHMMRNQQFKTFQVKIDQMIHTLENNRMELALLNENLDADYLTRARAAAYVMDKQEEVSMDVSKMQYLADLLNVDELHVIDEHGIIVSASVSEYVGFDMGNHEQTRAFLALLDSDDEDAYLIQKPQPNAAEGRIMQYVGVARKGQKGVVQVGFEPKRQMEAQSRNTYDYIFSRFPTDLSEELFAVDCDTGAVLGHSEELGRDFGKEYYQLDSLLTCTEGAYKPGAEGRRMYVVSRKYENALICAALPGEVLVQKLLTNTLLTLIYLIVIEIAVILLLNYLVKQNVINGMHHIIESLSAITDGNLDTTVSVGGNREFEELSAGINTMVSSIVNVSDRISAIIDMSGFPLAAFEYESGLNTVFVTSGLSTLMDISDKAVAEFCRNAKMFDSYIRRITASPIDGETEVYQLHADRYVKIHMSESSTGRLGVITDVTEDILEKNRMRYENTHDPLTGLYKYQHFQQLAEEMLRGLPAGEVCALVMLDLDYFKGINDTYGHDVGDKYLQSFSAVMKALPQEHFLASRRSGDEFSMMIFGCKSCDEVEAHLQAFYEQLGQSPVELSDTETRIISASAGFAWTNSADSEIAALLSHADEALYEVKRDTKGTYRVYC